MYQPSHKKPYQLDLPTLRMFDPEAEVNVAYLNSLNLCAIGITPYARIIPAFFLDQYLIYSATAPTDAEVLRAQTKLHTLEERHPDVARKVHATSYLIGNHHFQAFLRSQPRTPTLLISSPTHAIKEKLAELKISYLATESEAAEGIKTKRAFRDLLPELGVEGMPRIYVPREELLQTSWTDFKARYFERSVVQRADREVGGVKGTFFLAEEDAYNAMQEILREETNTEHLMISPFIEGPSLSMLGCVTSQGTLSGSLQLQFIDVPEALHGVAANGIFFGNDWGYHPWPESVDALASTITEKIGNHLSQGGYRGIFGVDFILDSATNALYPLECNPRITGASPVFSLMLLSQGLPPLEYYHLLALTGKDTTFNFSRANRALKQRIPCAHISLSPKGIRSMELPLPAGVYAYDEIHNLLEYRRPGFHLSDIRDPNEFLIIDTLPKRGSPVPQEVPGFFKFIFKSQIGISSNHVDARTKKILTIFADALINPERHIS